jgi:hypothetical protein
MHRSKRFEIDSSDIRRVKLKFSWYQTHRLFILPWSILQNLAFFLYIQQNSEYSFEMKRFWIILLLAIPVALPTLAQTPEKSANKVFRSDDNRLYINKNVGVYIWLSTSPDPDSEKYRLLSDSSRKYTNPMYFDTQGYNTLRSPWEVDTTTKQVVYPKHDIIFEVYADGLPPVSRAIYQSTFAKRIGDKVYYDKDLKIELQSYDAVSGIDQIWYNLNSDQFSAYKEPLASFREGENILKFYATDKVCNKEQVHEEFFYIDNSAPKTSYQIEGNRSDKYVSADAMIRLTANDNLSGIKTIYYRINNGSFMRYSVPIPVKLLTGENASISYYAEDNVGNKENIQTIGGRENSVVMEEDQPKQNVIFEFYIDRDPPELALEVKPEPYKANYTYISPRTQFIINAKDEKSGVDKIQYSINTSLYDTDYKNPFTLENKGLNYLHIRGSDYVGNISPAILKTFYCDPDAPRSTLTIGTPKLYTRDTLFVSSKTLFSIACKDEGSGVGSIKYSINGSTPVEYQKSFNLEGNGFTVLNFSAEDKVGNQEENNSTKVYVDNEKPVIHYHFSVESIGSKVVRDDDYTIYPTNVMLYIAITDKHSGGEKIEYSINGGALQTMNPIQSLKPDNYLIKINAYDVLGNKSVQEIKFAVEE